MKLSIIIPYYNSVKTISNVLYSIENIENVEYIFVNDGGSDLTTKKISYHCQDYDNYHILEKDNGGVSSARNAGIDIAKGDYILFLDSDDILFNGVIPFLIQYLESCNKDVVVFEYEKIKTVNYNRTVELSLTESFAYKQEFKRDYIEGVLINKVSVCSCLFNRDFIIQNNINFDEELAYGEDQIFMFDVLSYAKDIVYNKGNIILGYYYNVSSAMNTYNSSRLDFINKLENISDSFDIDRSVIDYRINKEIVGIGTIYYSCKKITSSFWFYNDVLKPKMKDINMSFNYSCKDNFFLKLPYFYLILYKTYKVTLFKFKNNEKNIINNTKSK